ncbi:hypothetical protein [Paenibacillus sp. FSL L8-0638]
MRIIIFELAAGSLVGLLSAGNMISRIGGRTVILGIAILIVSGGGYGTAEVALNAEGSVVENQLQKMLLPAFHGSFRMETLVGAVIDYVGVIVAGLISGAAQPIGMKEKKSD